MKCISKDNSLVGSDFYRDNSAAVPNAYKPTLVHTVTENKAQTNRTQKITVKVPVVTMQDGIATANDTFHCSLQFTSLQGVIADTEREAALKYVLAYATAALESLKDGSLPDEPVTFTIA